MSDEDGDVLPLFETKAAKGRLAYHLYAVSLAVGVCLICAYRLIHLPPPGVAGRWPWIGLFAAELWFSLYWFLTQFVRWNPVYRSTFKDRLSQRVEPRSPKAYFSAVQVPSRDDDPQLAKEWSTLKITCELSPMLESSEKDQADDKANPKPWYTADEKSGKMSTEDLQNLIREYPLPEGWYACLPGLQEPANYGTKFETGVYDEQVKSGYRLLLHPFALCFFEHYRMALGQLVPNGWRKLAGLIYLVQTSSYKPDATDFMRVNPGKPTPNNQTKHILSHIKLRGGLSIDEPLSEEQLEWVKIIPQKPILAGLSIPPPPPAIPSMSSVETVPLGEAKREATKCGVAPAPKKVRVTPLEHSLRILDQVSIEDDPIFRPRWTLRRDDPGMPDSQVAEQHLLHGILPRDKKVFQNQTHETFACSFAQDMYASGSEMLSRFEMARQVAAEEAQQKRDAVKEAQEATHRAEELSKREEDYLAKIMTLEKRLEPVKRKAAEEVTKARDQGIRDFLDENTGDEWLKKWTEDGLEIYELGFTKAKEMFAERFPDIPLEDFVLPAVASPSRETAMPSEAGDAAASHPSGEGPSGDAPEP
ncbi:hypothetical protein RJ639_010985 [Escallonia herrerae]|uniref:Uncharacterized protein n=1 Tax=Escallonia herrerae TaxID=1293975 RepID=A0AA89APD4_9ASTE|nr:hypothetical protein RJ639_010985 [Escallonia herrerae]